MEGMTFEYVFRPDGAVFAWRTQTITAQNYDEAFRLLLRDLRLSPTARAGTLSVRASGSAEWEDRRFEPAT